MDLSNLRKGQMGDKEAMDQFIESQLKLVTYAINRYLRSFKSDQQAGYEWDDVFQAGCEGLVIAAQNFDFSRGNKWSSYAVSMIVYTARKMASYQKFGVTIPRRLGEVMSSASWIKQDNPEISRSDLEKELRKCHSDYYVSLFMNMEIGALSLNNLLNSDEDDEFIDMVAETSDSSFEEESFFLSYTNGIKNETHRKILYLNLYKGFNQVEIARMLGVSQPTISRVIAKYLPLIQEAYAS